MTETLDFTIHRRHKSFVLKPEDRDYPMGFFAVQKCPPLLYVWGNPIWTKRKTLGVVGSREPSKDALSWMDLHLPQGVSDQYCVVSGGARGVDQRAHQISLISGLPTVVVLPSGFQQIYPATLSTWIDPILDGGGCFLSFWPKGQVMRKGHFHMRNRFLAALSDHLLVVEARRRSGTMLTAQYAMELGRSVATLPSSPMSEASLGNLDLIVDGAVPLRDQYDLKVFLSSSSP